MEANAPNRKILAAGLAGAITSILAWVLIVTTDVEIPANVAAAITTVLTFAAGYFVPEGE